MTRTAEEVRREIAKRKRKDKGKNDWFQLKEGRVYIRIGPPWKKGGEFWKDVLTHGSFKDKVYCRQNDINPETGKPRKCPIEERLEELKGNRTTKSKKLWSIIKQRNESLWNILAAKVKRRDDGSVKVVKYVDNRFKIWRLSSKWQTLLMDIFADEDYRKKSILGVTHSKYGRLIRVEREGTGRDDTTYKFKAMEQETPILPDKEERMTLLKTLVDLDSIVHGSSKEELEAFLAKAEKTAKKLARLEEEEEGEESEEDEDEEEEDAEEEEEEEEEEEKPKEKKGKKSKDEDEEESEDESEEDEDEDEDDLEKKYKKMKKKIAKKEEEEEDEEGEEDSEEKEEDESEDEEDEDE